MGAWGVRAFENDTACDWAYELEDSDDLSLVRETLTRILAVGNEYLDSSDACEGLASCEVVARLKGNWGVRDAHTESVDIWVQNNSIQPSSDLINQALAVIDRVLTAPSELMELWDETAEKEEWHESVANLRSRVAT
jgi:Domain of unknown function (DUF4259)